jgi:hypothetical protein
VGKSALRLAPATNVNDDRPQGLGHDSEPISTTARGCADGLLRVLITTNPRQPQFVALAFCLGDLRPPPHTHESASPLRQCRDPAGAVTVADGSTAYFISCLYMSLRVLTTRKIYTSTTSAALKYRSLGHIAKQSHFSLTTTYSSPSRQAYHYGLRSAVPPHSKSSTGIYTALVAVGIAIGGALLFPLVRNSPEKDTKEHTTPSPTFEYSDLTDSYLIMAPNTPPGRPGTLTPQEEVKLRELWAATMKVFGVYEPPSTEANDAESIGSAPVAANETAEPGKKDKKKKSRLHVFKRNKGEKGGDTESKPSSGTATPSDLSSLSIADEDDKHGQGKEFKVALASTAPEDLRQAFWSMVKHDHPDGLLLRFLRARKWDVDKALIMMISTMHWRSEEMHVDDDIVMNGELAALNDSKSDDPSIKKEGEDFLAQMRMGKSFLHGLDKDGRPMCIVRARLHKQGEQSEKSLERFTVYTIETARMLLRPPVDTAVSSPSPLLRLRVLTTTRRSSST